MVSRLLAKGVPQLFVSLKKTKSNKGGGVLRNRTDHDVLS